MMVRNTWWISIITTVVLLLVCGSITTKAAESTYKYYIQLSNGTYQIWYTDQQIELSVATGTEYFDPNTGMYIERDTSTRPVYNSALTSNAFIMSYDGTNWSISLPVVSANGIGTNLYRTVYGFTSDVVTSFSNTKPNDFPEEPTEPDLDQMINDGINNVLNDSTDVTSEAKEIEDEVNYYLQLFNNGELSKSEFLIILTRILGSLEELNPTTLVDMEAVNNLYNMINLSISQITNSNMQTSEELQAFVMAFYEYVNETLENYKSGVINYNQAMEELQLYLSVMPEIAVGYDSEADQTLINNLITYINGTQEIIHNMNDISTDVSESVIQSDQEEIDYLDELISETQKSISELSPSEDLTPQQIQTATEIINGIWDNPIIIKIIPLAACFMVVCVVLGVKYRL